MQKSLTNYTSFTLWSTIALIIAAPLYIFFDLGFRQSYETEKIHDEYIKKGSYLYAEFCVGCHGLKGGGSEEDKALQGLPLNKTKDMIARDDKDPFIIKTIARGRRGTVMPAWLKEEGGPLDIEDIKMLRAFIRDGKRFGEFFHYTSLSSKAWKPAAQFSALVAAADAEKHGISLNPVDLGKQIFNGPCAVCHNTTADQGGKLGPGLAGVMTTAGKKLPNGKDVNEENLKEWITKGSASYKQPTQLPFMPAYGEQVQGKNLDNVIEYLKTLK